ncbi:MAG: hypothetical protein R2788_05855 [Saprospiraceae bacterium]
MEFGLGPADEEFCQPTNYLGKTKSQFVWDIVGGKIDKNYMKPTGFTAMMANGILAGYNIESMKVRAFDGSMHAVDSKPIALLNFVQKEGFL